LERYREDLFEGELGDVAQEWSIHFLKSEYARVAGDTDLLIRVHAGKEPVYYPGIVAVLDGDGRPGEALEWAERGLREGGGHVWAELVDYVVGAYRKAGRTEDIRALRWELFERSPESGTYQALRADSLEQEWPAVR